MQTYKIVITEICKGQILVDAESREEALEIAETAYWECPNDYFLEVEDTLFE